MALTGNLSRRGINPTPRLDPLIDLLLCFVSFLLLTCALSDEGRLSVDVRVPWPSCKPLPPTTVSTVHMLPDGRFRWKFPVMSGVPEVVVPAEPRDGPAHALRRSARVVARLPKANGGGVVLLAVANSLEYRDIVRAVDALTVPWRPGTNEPYLYVKLLPRAPQL